MRARERGRARMPRRCGCFRMYVGVIPRACFAGRGIAQKEVHAWPPRVAPSRTDSRAVVA